MRTPNVNCRHALTPAAYLFRPSGRADVHNAQLSIFQHRLYTVTTLAAILAGLLTLLAVTIVRAEPASQVRIATDQQVVTLRPTQDTYIDSTAASTNYSTAIFLAVEQHINDGSTESHALLQFDLSDIPPRASIQHAELRLFQRETNESTLLAIDHITSPWDAGSVTWEEAPPATPYYSELPVAAGNDVTVSFDITDLVIDWHETPQNVPNYGLKLRVSSEQEFSAHQFDSSRGDYPPELHILYTPAQVAIPGGAPDDELNAACVTDNERYANGAHFNYLDQTGSLSTISLAHGADSLYICVGSDGFTGSTFGVFIDSAQGSTTPPSTPDSDQISLRIYVPFNGLTSWRGTGDPGETYAEDTLLDGLWDAVADQSDPSFGPHSAEFRIPLSLLGPHALCHGDIGLAVYHQDDELGTPHGWPRQDGPDNPASWATVQLQDTTCPIRVICTETDEPCTPATDVQVIDADTGAIYTVDSAGYVLERDAIVDGDRLWARVPFTESLDPPYTVYHTSGTPQTVGQEEYDLEPLGEMTLHVGPGHPLMTYDLDVTAQWRVEDDPEYAAWLIDNLEAASAYLYRFSHDQIALGEITIRQDWDGWEDSDIRLHAHNNLRPDAILGGVNKTPQFDPDNDLLAPEVEGDIIYWPGEIRIGSQWNRFNVPPGAREFTVDVSDDWAVVLAHEFGHYMLYLLDTYFRVGPNDTIIDVYTCTGSAMGWVYFPDNHGFVADPQHWNDNCRETYGNDLLNRHEWATLTRFFPWLQPPDAPAHLSTSELPAGITSIQLIPTGQSPNGLPNQPIDLLYQEQETASTQARAFIFRNNRIIDQGNAAPGSTQIHLIGSQADDRLCLIDINVRPPSPVTPRHQFGCDMLTAGNNALPLRKDTTWAPEILLTPATTLTVEIEVLRAPDAPLIARFYPQDRPGWIEASLAPQSGATGAYTGVFQLDAPATFGFVQLFVDESEAPGSPRREAIIDYGANGGGLPGPTSLLGWAPIVSSSDGLAVFLLTEGVILAEGEFIAWQSMIGGPQIPTDLTALSQPYRLIALPPALVDTGVVSIRYPPPETAGIHAASSNETQQSEDSAIYFWDGSMWIELETNFAEDPNGDVITSATSQGMGVYALLAPGPYTPPSMFIPYIVR